MSWKRYFRRRKPITIVNTAGSSSGIDANVTIPADWDEFWDAIDASGNELRVTGPDGYTAVSYDLDDGSGGAFDRTNRLGRLQLDALTAPGVADEALLFWLYFDSTATQGDGTSAVSISGALTGYIDRGQPSTWIAHAEPPRPGNQAPRQKFGKSASDDLFCWLEVTDLLEQRASPHANRSDYELPRSIKYEVQLSSSEAAQSSMIDLASTRWVEVVGERRRRLFARLRVKAGTTAEQYTLVATIPTCVPLQSGTHRTPVPRVGFRVKNVLET